MTEGMLNETGNILNTAESNTIPNNDNHTNRQGTTLNTLADQNMHYVYLNISLPQPQISKYGLPIIRSSARSSANLATILFFSSQ